MVRDMLFRAASVIFGSVTLQRNNLYDAGILRQVRTSLPVVSVGNITVGGNGKSPFTSYLAQGAISRAKHPVVLLRGYGGKIKGPHLVSGADSPSDVGDEAVMHYRSLSPEVAVVIGADRCKAIEFIEGDNLGDLVLLDDGFQHRRVARNLDIVLQSVGDGQRPEDIFQAEHLLPLGRLREEQGRALRRADVVVSVTKSLEGGCQAQDCEEFVFHLSPQCLRDVFSGERFSLEQIKDKKVCAVAALADNEGFFRLLDQLGAQNVERVGFADHHHYCLADWQRAGRSGREPVITTVKDSAKLEQFVSAPNQLHVLELKGSFVSSAMEDRFWDILNRVL